MNKNELIADCKRQFIGVPVSELTERDRNIIRLLNVCGAHLIEFNGKIDEAGH